MKIYGVAFLAGCYLVGQLVGQYLGVALGIGGNVGGVGIGMLLLVLINHRFYRETGMNPETKAGILFWTSMYIPVVIAMSSILNVKAAVSGGWVAIAAGVLATSFCYLLVPALSKLSNTKLKGPEL